MCKVYYAPINITTIAGGGAYGLGDGGAATNASLSAPFGVAVDASGNLFIADTVNFRIRKVSNTQEPVLVLNNVSAADAGNYQVVVTSSGGCVTSSVAILTVVPSFITQQPQDQMVLTSSNATFSVSASGATPMSYQWFFSNTNLQTDAGAIAEILYGFVYGAVVTNVGSGYTTVPNVQFIGGGGSGAGGTAVVSNGMVTTINVTNAGSDYTTLPAVQIDPPSGLLIGHTNATLNLNTVTTDNAGNYFVVVSNVYGSVTSSVATLIIVAGPAIVHQPQSVSVLEGNNATFNACASGTTPLSYQWWMGASQQSNATAVPFIINGFVLAANITSGGAGYLTVPEVQFVGGSGSGASGIAVVSNRMVTAINMISAGSGYTTPPTIQIDAPSAVILPGQTNATLLISAATGDNIGNYFMVVTNNYGSVPSATAGLVVFLPALNIVGSSSNNYQLTLQLTGNPNYPYTLQSATNLTPPVNWQTVLTNFADTNGNWSAIITNLANPPAGFYRIVGQ